MSSSKLSRINPDISKAQLLDKSFYIKDDIFKNTIKNVFSISWQFVVDIKRIDNNSIYPFIFLKDSLNEPMILTITNDKIKCLSNVCTHRAHLIENSMCNKNSLQCPYHGRTFSMDGKIISAIGFNKVKNFPIDSDNLKNYSFFIWHNFIFSSMNAKINIKNILLDIDKRLPYYDFSNIRFNNNNSKT